MHIYIHLNIHLLQLNIYTCTYIYIHTYAHVLIHHMGMSQNRNAPSSLFLVKKNNGLGHSHIMYKSVSPETAYLKCIPNCISLCCSAKDSIYLARQITAKTSMISFVPTPCKHTSFERQNRNKKNLNLVCPFDPVLLCRFLQTMPYHKGLASR